MVLNYSSTSSTFPLNLSGKKISVEGARPEKGFTIWAFSESPNQNLHFGIFSKNSIRNELQSPFLPYFGTQHSICDFQLGFVKRCFWLKQKKNIFVLGVPKVFCAGVKLSFWNFFFIGASAIKSRDKSRIFRYGLSKGQKTTGGGLQDPTPHAFKG